jgi:hypothetical protein
LNNIGGSVKDKVAFLKEYKFTIAFENSSYPGYVTEKIYQPMFQNTIPIYWGSQKIGLDFNTKSFLNRHEYPSDEALIEKIIELDQNNDLYFQMLKEPWFANNDLNSFIKAENIEAFFHKVFSYREQPIAQTWKKNIGFIIRKARNFNKKMTPKFR